MFRAAGGPQVSEESQLDKGGSQQLPLLLLLLFPGPAGSPLSPGGQSFAAPRSAGEWIRKGLYSSGG